jgi:Uncharacterised nucleotidyltransferase
VATTSPSSAPAAGLAIGEGSWVPSADAEVTGDAMSGVQWDRVNALIDASPGVEDLRAHGLQLLAARRWRSAGLLLPAGLVREELQALWRTHASPRVLEEIRTACTGPIMLMKGPAAAARYPDPSARPFIDLDLLVPNARATQAELRAADFQLSGDPEAYPDDLHHLPPVYSPNHPIPIEVHSRLKWPDGLNPPTFEVLAAAAEHDAHGILIPSPAHHALVLAGHLWAHDPLARLIRILDIALMADASEPRELEVLADAWGMGRLWSTTSEVAAALFGTGDGLPRPLRTWARGLCTAREPTVLEVHLGRLLSPFSIYEPLGALRAVSAAIAGFAMPHDGEHWRRKLARTAQQIARPTMRRSEHSRAIEADRHSRRD